MIIPSTKNERSFWNYINKNELINKKEIMKQIPRSSFYRILNRIEKMQNQLKVNFLSYSYTMFGEKIIKRCAQIQIKDDIVYVRLKQ